MEVVAVLTSTTSRCEIRKHTSGDEAGDQIEVRCGDATTSLGRALKGLSVNRISGCRVVLTVNAVHSPRLLSLSNCRKPLKVVDVGSVWTTRLQKSANIKPESVEFVAYEKIARRIGCYDITITYDANPNSSNTAYEEKKGQFCIEAQ